ncbi:unnamed protein product [Rotaria sp. Silwood2]|nr:unnamed protein product [Rotaria sp. Silwood2]CAF4574638.1 unnamed protein product [Rotaria sp. Silwood2]
MDVKENSYKTWFDRLPNEITFLMFDYLSINDILYTFFFFNERFNNLLLKHQHYFKYFELPKTNLDFWKNILSIINLHIEYLNITTIDLTLPLTLFPNLKSIIISSPYGFPYENLKLIFESSLFNNLHSLRIKRDEIKSNIFYNDFIRNEDNVLEEVFNNKNSLKIFEYPTINPSFTTTEAYINNFEQNISLHSLKLLLTDFQDIFTLLLFTPNLEYLNVKCEIPKDKQSMKVINVKLKQFHLTLVDNISMPLAGSSVGINFKQLTDCIKQFSSSLICLSIYFNVPVPIQDEFYLIVKQNHHQY